MNLAVFLFTIFSLQLFCLYIGSRSSKKMKTLDDYFLAGKGIKFFPLMMTFVATQVGGGLVLGAAQEAYIFGWSVLLYPLGSFLGLLLLAVGIGKKMAQFQVSTVAQLLEIVYRSSTLKKIASSLSVLSLFMILVAQIIASKKFMTSLGAESTFIFIGFWGIVILYTFTGGLKAVVATDIVQVLFFIIVFLLCFGYAVSSTETSLFKTLQQGIDNNNFKLDSVKFCGWILMPLLFMVIEQDMAQRCFAANTPKVVSKATFCAACCTMVICIIPIYFGVLGKNLGIEVSPNSSVLMEIIQATTTPTIAALAGCAILAAIISTADSLINAISSNLSQDFEIILFKNKLKTSQMITVIISSIGIFFSFYFDNIVDILIQSYELSVSCLFIPVAFALFKRQKGHFLSASTAMVFGAAAFCLFRIYPVEYPKEILSVFLSLVGYFIGECYVRISPISKSQKNVIQDRIQKEAVYE